MVGHVLEYHPAVLKLRELIDEGALGKLLYLYSNRLNFGRVRTEENALWSFAPHDIALLLRLMGEMPEEVAVRGATHLNDGVADASLMSLRFPKSVPAHVFVSWLHPFKEQRFVAVGDRQMAVFDDTAPWEEKLLLYPSEVDWVGGKVPIARKAEAIPVPLEPAEPLAGRVRGVRAGDREPGGAAHGRRERSRTCCACWRRGSDRWIAAASPSRSSGRRPPASSRIRRPRSTKGRGSAAGTRIWHYAHVMGGSRIGKDCVLGQNTFVGADVRIGHGVKIQNNVSLYDGVELDDFVFCGPSVVFTNVMNPRSEIERKSEFRRTLGAGGARRSARTARSSAAPRSGATRSSRRARS